MGTRQSKTWKRRRAAERQNAALVAIAIANQMMASVGYSLAMERLQLVLSSLNLERFEEKK